jgi:hypothetical protein
MENVELNDDDDENYFDAKDMYIINCLQNYMQKIDDDPLYNFTYCNQYGNKFIDVEHNINNILKAYDIGEIMYIISNKMQLKIDYISIQNMGGIVREIYPNDSINKYHKSKIIDVKVYLK